MSNLLAKLAMLLLVVCFSLRAATAQEIEQSTGLVCDEPSQMEQFFALTNAGATNDAALAKVNETNPTACLPLTVAYVRGNKVSEVNVNGGKVEIFAITIVAVHQNGMWQRVVPQAQFAAYFKKLENV